VATFACVAEKVVQVTRRGGKQSTTSDDCCSIGNCFFAVVVGVLISKSHQDVLGDKVQLSTTALHLIIIPFDFQNFVK